MLYEWLGINLMHLFHDHQLNRTDFILRANLNQVNTRILDMEGLIRLIQMLNLPIGVHDGNRFRAR